MTLVLRYAARSHTGLLRTGNEDSAYAGPRLLAVADGMGGHAAGEVASAVAIAALAPLDDDLPGPDLLAALRTSAVSANEHLHDMVEGDPALEGMGTTLVALLFAGGRLGLLHVGDSRCYLLRDGELTQITHDHTLVQTLVDEGRISEEEASTHPQRSLITRALDGRGDVELDLSVREARAGDRYLLCTDGLTGPVGRRETLLESLQIPDPQASADRLLDLALRGGGPDNITMIVADVVESAQATDTVVVAGAAADAPQSAPGGDSAASTTSATIIVMLSGPPPRRARSSSRSAQACGSGICSDSCSVSWRPT
ncbi:MAG: pstP1, partial [Frankiales bacterium]|nr:pstP1 [Frankiales bacterium]